MTARSFCWRARVGRIRNRITTGCPPRPKARFAHPSGTSVITVPGCAFASRRRQRPSRYAGPSASENLAMPHMPATGVSGIDLYTRTDGGRWTLCKNGRPISLSNEASFRVTPGTECMLYLPLYNGVKSLQIGVPRDKTMSKPAESPGTAEQAHRVLRHFHHPGRMCLPPGHGLHGHRRKAA